MGGAVAGSSRQMFTSPSILCIGLSIHACALPLRPSRAWVQALYKQVGIYVPLVAVKVSQQMTFMFCPSDARLCRGGHVREESQ